MYQTRSKRCSRKHGRRDALVKRRKQQSSVESTHNLCLVDIDDNLLLEVLLRLPTAKHDLICSSVCKKWYRLILNDFFIGRFVSYHMDHDINYNCNISIRDPDTSHEALLLCQNPKFQIKKLDSSSFCEESQWVKMLSSCHDLVLCVARMKLKEEEGFSVARMKEEEKEFRYFICNFLTMQKTDLPAPAVWLKDMPFQDDITCAFICKPYCARDTQGRCTPNPGYHYRALRFLRGERSDAWGLPVEMYCSETGQWRRYGGKFCDTSKGFCIPHPDIEQWHPDTEQQMSAFLFRVLGICQGRLRFMELGNLYGKELTADPEAACLRVWDLKDYENKEWSMERQVCLYTLASQSESVFELFANWNDLTMRMLAPHPFNEDVIYLSFNDIIASCNMRTEELEVLAEFPGGHLMAYNEHETSAKLITIPWWPTTILQHSQQ